MNVEFVNGCLMVVGADGRRFVSDTSKFKKHGLTKLNMEATLSPLIAAKQYTYTIHGNLCVISFNILVKNKSIAFSTTLTEKYQIDIITSVPDTPENMLGLFQSMQRQIQWLHDRVAQLESEAKPDTYDPY